MLITADHGNAEQMADEQGEPHTAHTCNPVWLILVDDSRKDAVLKEGGKLADIAPTMLKTAGAAATQRDDRREPAMKTVSIPATGNEYIVGKILCIGRNYVDHIKELGNETPSAPVVFMKPATAIITEGEQIRIPAYSQDCHYEAELAVLIGSDGKDIPGD